MKTKIMSKKVRIHAKRRLPALIDGVTDKYEITLEELAKELGVKPVTLSSWHTGRYSPNNYDKYVAIRKHLICLLDKDELAVKYPLRKFKPHKPPVRSSPNPESEPQIVTPLQVQIGGSHYKDCKIQPIEYIEGNQLAFLEGCVVKRVTRHNKPSGKGRQDIEKAIHELQLLLELRYRGVSDEN